MRKIDILLAIDEKGIIDHNIYSKDSANPELVDSKYIRVLTYDGDGKPVVDNTTVDILDDTGGKHFEYALKLSGIRKDDNIRWRGISLSPVDTAYYAVLTKFVPDKDNFDSYTQYIDRTALKTQSNNMQVFDENGMLTLKENVPKNYWLNVVIRNAPNSPESVILSYTGNFTVYNAEKVVGYCQWKHNLILSN
ncbi:AidA/PixA family protein [Xenorhabdus bovienii]|uniref:AidA/PixA family protein n=1 Tax=Xenorhabdus bovienii TaxID=40576 RepID=UPI00237C67F4|nr:AidA/PixA family protein [Xenorhabdus bovienii]MDE1475503.1 inclusion body family protein [Xenorhabdus bovienii]